VDAATREGIEKGLAELKSTLEGGDKAAIEEKTNVLLQASMKLGEAMYKAQQEGAAGGAASSSGDASSGSGAANDDKVVDATFEEVDEKRKNG
jgi:molecular chaperone DnaK